MRGRTVQLDLAGRRGIVSHDEQVVAIRDSKNPAGPALLLTYDALAGLVGALQRGVLR
ncbi:DUF397 domain-containing protein [Streptomyces sp. I05A-00742]|uniref:DUF397 domain-containing protein n=1 Tax=Streptomyces sp. I05A-00742 TaxID=2732853 RepID=UPI0014894C12|nr:DUF397 domain-containing protein [Streptomyces sp. I05A-00742]